MDFAMQQEVWTKLPLTDFQRQAILKDLMSESNVPIESDEDIEVAPQKKRKRTLPIERSESSHHMY
jgi:hypothetical protein